MTQNTIDTTSQDLKYDLVYIATLSEVSVLFKAQELDKWKICITEHYSLSLNTSNLLVFTVKWRFSLLIRKTRSAQLHLEGSGSSGQGV